jgi:hypothetical protein
MTDKPTSTVPGHEAGKAAAELFGRMTRLLVYGNGGGVTACLVIVAATIQAGVYTAWIVAPLALFWLGLVLAFLVLALLHTSAVARVAEEHVLVGTMMKRRYRGPLVGWEFALSDNQHKAGAATGPTLIASGVFFVIGSFSGFGLLLLA